MRTLLILALLLATVPATAVDDPAPTYNALEFVIDVPDNAPADACSMRSKCRRFLWTECKWSVDNRTIYQPTMVCKCTVRRAPCS